MPPPCRVANRAFDPDCVLRVSTGKTYDATPGFVAVSMGTPPYIAMTLGDKVVTIMDYSGVYKYAAAAAQALDAHPCHPLACR